MTKFKDTEYMDAFEDKPETSAYTLPQGKKSHEPPQKYQTSVGVVELNTILSREGINLYLEVGEFCLSEEADGNRHIIYRISETPDKVDILVPGYRAGFPNLQVGRQTKIEVIPISSPSDQERIAKILRDLTVQTDPQMQDSPKNINIRFRKG